MTAATRARPSWWDAAAAPAPPPAPAPAVPVDPVEHLAPDIPGAPLLNDPEERAAIIAEGAGVPRAWAEGYAALCAMPPPAGFWSDRWRRIVDATGAFLAGFGAEVAELGWSELDVFGVDSDAPAARFDCMGLAALLGATEVTAVDERGADTMVVATGARQRFRRRQLPPGTVPLWELQR